ncbi:transcriptional regulator [Rhodococcus sp. NPDC060176]|uniref:transcriptional regulator n=1 Tax=Rhodococcus sp. NPDC060176 TaxID=3347062 RepID=UPI0004A928E3|nr:hypothetical protein EN35_16475 [Rhodococcus qingshengii]
MTTETDETRDAWDLAQVDRIGSAIKAIRGEKSAQWLSERTAELGHKISRSTITDIENKRRKYISTSEVCILAFALNVPPVRLLYPSIPDGLVEVVPGVTLDSFSAVQWFAGEGLIPRLDLEIHGMKPSEGTRVLGFVRHKAELEKRRGSLAKLIGEQVKTADTGLIDTLTQELSRLDRLIEFIATELKEDPDAVVIDSDGR